MRLSIFLASVTLLASVACSPPSATQSAYFPATQSVYVPEGTLKSIEPGVYANFYLATSAANVMNGKTDGTATLRGGCIVDLLRPGADGQALAYVRLVRCDMTDEVGPIDPKTGTKATKLTIYDGWVGYTQQLWLTPYDGPPVKTRSS